MSSKFSLRFDPDPAIRVVCEPLTSEEVNGLLFHENSEPFLAVRAMTEVWEAHKANGIAANQVGYNKAVFIFTTNKGGRLAINPRILSYGDRTSVVEEGCLSWPGHTKKIERPRRIMVEYIDEHGMQHEKEQLDGHASRVFQHEYDHLRGILIQDLDEWSDTRTWKLQR